MNKLNLSVLLLASVFLTACGGGTTSARSDSTSTSRFSGVDDAQYKSAAAATPKQGSVIQSNINNRPNLGVNATNTGVAFIDIANGQNVTVGGATDRTFNDVSLTKNTDGNPDLNSPSFSFSGYERQLDAGRLYVLNAVAEYGDVANDYLSYGLWGYQADNDNHEIGFYVDGGDSFTVGNITALTGQTTYSTTEGAVAVYQTSDGSGAALGDVSLTADFDTNTIGGRIDNVKLYNFDSLEGDGVVSNIVIDLGDTSISTTEEGGFWTGDTAGSNASESYTGKWGGQFYGNGDGQPNIAAGTFGGANADGSESFVGAFIALKE